jgi:hypothetical protein
MVMIGLDIGAIVLVRNRALNRALAAGHLRRFTGAAEAVGPSPYSCRAHSRRRSESGERGLLSWPHGELDHGPSIRFLGVTPVDQNGLAGDEAGFLRTEEKRHLG